MNYDYDVFVSYRWVEPDQTWVRERLVPALEAANLKVCLDVNDFTPGRDLMLEMERAGNTSHRALCIITPSYFDGNRMVGFEALMARRRDPSGAESKLIPLILQKTSMPEWIRGLVPIDWTRSAGHQREWKKLLKVLGSQNLTAPAPPGLDQITPATEASAPTPVHSQPEARRKLRFADEVKADVVAVTLAVSASHRESSSYEIVWPETTLRLLECVRGLLGEVENHHSPESRFHAVEPKILKDFAEMAEPSLRRADKLIACAANRIPYLLNGMNGYWGQLNSPQEHALANYLTLANITILEAVLSPLRFKILYDTFFPKRFAAWIASDKAPIKDAFDIHELLYTARLSRIEDRTTYGYYWGPASDLLDAYRLSAQHRALTNSWYARFLIPQFELELANLCSTEQINYRENATLSKLSDENGREVNPHTNEILD